MRSIRRTLVRMAAVLRGHETADEELRAEMRAHLEMEIEENLRRGMSPGEARRQASIAAGGLTRAAERVREQRGLPWIESLGADVRYAVRHFRRTPLSTGTAILVLSLGIGTAVVVFTLLNSVATMPPPGIRRDDTLVRIRGITEGFSGVQARLMSWPEVRDYGARTDLFSGVAAHADETALVELGNEGATPSALNVIYTTPSYFSVLGVQPALGGEPAAGPDVTDLAESPTAVISHAMWEERFGGAPDVIGRTLRVNDYPVEIVGVAPPRFIGTEGRGRITLWIPLAAYPLLQKQTEAPFMSYERAFLNVAARLRPDVTAEAAAAVVAGIAERAFHAGRQNAPPQAGDRDATLPQREAGSADVVPMLASNSRITQRSDLVRSGVTAAGLALMVLLVTCATVSALMAGLAVARRREIGLRLALGGRRLRLVRQLLTESILLALIASCIGLLATAVGIRIIDVALEDLQLVVDWRVTTATFAVAIVTGLLFGISPALHATRASVGEVLKGDSPSSAATRPRLQQALVVAQITLTQPLLVGLGVMVATMATDITGGATAGAPAQIAEIELDTWGGRVSMGERASTIATAVERVAGMPGVIAAMPMQAGTFNALLAVHPADRIEGVDYEAMEASLVAVPEGYLEAFEIPLVRGRDFTAAERARLPDAPIDFSGIDAVIIGSDLAHRLWRDADPLGRRLTSSPSRPDAGTMVVVGVVEDEAAGPSEVGRQLRVYVPHVPINTGVIARTAGPALPMLNAMRRLVAAEAPHMPISRAETMEQREAKERRDVIRAGGAAAAGGLIALFLSAIGLYAVVSFAVGQRRREIGIRMAVGARREQVTGMFYGQGLALSALGLLLGLPLSMLATALVARALNWPLASSPMIGLAIAAVVLVVAMAAVWAPARRASRVDPMVALRAE